MKCILFLCMVMLMSSENGMAKIPAGEKTVTIDIPTDVQPPTFQDNAHSLRRLQQTKSWKKCKN